MAQLATGAATAIDIRTGQDLVPMSSGKAQNLLDLFFGIAAEQGNAPFLWCKIDQQWRPLNWTQCAETVAKMAGALRSIGLQPGDRVLLVSENRPEWCLADLAIMCAGGITVPTYTTNTERDHLHVAENSGASIAIVSTPKLAKTLLPAIYQSSQCKKVIGIEPLKIGQASSAELYDWQQLITESHTTVAQARAWANFKRDDLACLIYTSGTGGAPRGVMLSHGAMLANVEAGDIIITEDFPATPDIFLSFLPLSHAYEHTMSQFFALKRGAQIYYAESLDKLAANIEEVRPTVMVVVPRLFDVLRQRVIIGVNKQGKIAAFLLKWALKLGEKRTKKSLNFFEKIFDSLLDRTIRKKVADRFGGRNKALVAGGAPLNPEAGIFFQALGLTLLQGYGQTEAAPLISCNRPKSKIKMNSVGPPVPGVEVRIADDGEICVRGELVMKGYWRNEIDTALALQNGWLHTGDIGHIDEDGHIVITDRKKDIIVNDKGDNVSPQRVEGMLTLEPEISQAMVHGDKRPHLVGLIVPDADWLQDWARSTGKSANLALLASDAELHSAMQAVVDRVNMRLSVTEKIRKISIASEPFTTDNEMMTPTLKIRRHVIRKIYGDKLNALYGQ
jgi:long-chain acyl-CoA synthetase